MRYFLLIALTSLRHSAECDHSFFWILGFPQSSVRWSAVACYNVMRHAESGTLSRHHHPDIVPYSDLVIGQHIITRGGQRSSNQSALTPPSNRADRIIRTEEITVWTLNRHLVVNIMYRTIIVLLVTSLLMQLVRSQPARNVSIVTVLQVIIGSCRRSGSHNVCLAPSGLYSSLRLRMSESSLKLFKAS